MIEFKELKIKNFLSVGDNGITIKLNKSPTTLIVGKNGSGEQLACFCGNTKGMTCKNYKCGVNR